MGVRDSQKGYHADHFLWGEIRKQRSPVQKPLLTDNILLQRILRVHSGTRMHREAPHGLKTSY